MSGTWKKDTLYHNTKQSRGGYVVVIGTDQYYVEAQLFTRLKDAKVAVDGGTPERNGKPIIMPKVKFGTMFRKGTR